MKLLAVACGAIALVAGSVPAAAQFRVNKEEVSFANGTLRLAGSLHRPKSTQPVPAVVLIHGSGQTDRSSLDYFARAFAEEGVAALAYDKRGVGKSQGPQFAWRDYNFHDLAADAAAGVAFLRSSPGIDTANIGIFGASQGGWVAPLAAQQAGGVAFLVLVSASVTTVATDNLFERDARLKREGFTDAEVAEARAMHLVDLDVSRNGSRFDEFTRLWNESKAKRWFPRVYLGTAPAAPDAPFREWYRTVMDVDPVQTLNNLPCPALWVFGDPDLDRFSPVRESVAALERLRASGKQYDVHVLSGADHSLQVKGEESPFRPILAAWLRMRVPRPAPAR